MCREFSARIIELLDNKKALVEDIQGEKTEISLQFLGCATLGDHVAYSDGSAIRKIHLEEMDDTFCSA